jgi:hypothetical protein
VRQKLATLVAVLAAVPTMLWARPLMLPMHDVVVEYHTRGIVAGPQGTLTSTVMVRFAGNGGRLRVDGPYGGFYALIDVDGGRMIMVMPDKRIYVDQPADPYLIDLLQADDPSFQKVGVDRVAGLGCTDYVAAINGHTGRVCLTDDGVLLRARIEDSDRRPALDAVSVTYAPQDSELFEVPEGFHRVSLPRLPAGMSLGPLGNSGRDSNAFDGSGR